LSYIKFLIQREITMSSGKDSNDDLRNEFDRLDEVRRVIFQNEQ